MVRVSVIAPVLDEVRREQARVVVFARAPVLGAVKTRLAADVGAARALELYRWLGARVVRALARDAARAYDVHVAFTPQGPDSERLVRAWLPWADAFAPQRAGDLGARMAGALADALAQGCTRVLIVGTDCAGVSAARAADAFAALARAPCVLGPAADGGYYLIGAARPLPVFDQMPWSTDRVLALTRARLAQAGLAWAELPVERDVDTAADLAALAALETDDDDDDDVPGWIAAIAARGTTTDPTTTKE